MKIASLATLSLLAGLAHAEAPSAEALAKEAASLIPPFQQELLQTVKTAVSEGGPAQAIEACNQLAPQIASQHSQAPWQVGRTALKVRNPDNAPDAWERKVLEQFAERAAAGEPLEQLRHGEVVGNEYRYLQAIGTGEACVGCHGKQIKPALLSLIDERYPTDQARGFSEGDLRGAFSLRRALAE